MKKRTLLSALLSVVLCLSLITGATLALFTSESQTNIAITSGEVKVVATVDNNSVESKALNTDWAAGENNTFAQGVEVGESSVDLKNIVPGDGVKFVINVQNDSTVAIKYRTILSVENDNGLFAGLTVSINNNDVAWDGNALVDDWADLAVGANPASVAVKIVMEDAVDNDLYQGKSCKISYKVEAVQGNAEVDTFIANQEALNEALATAQAGDAFTLGTGTFSIGNSNSINPVDGVTFVGLGAGTVISSINGTTNCTFQNAKLSNIYTCFGTSFVDCLINAPVPDSAKASRASGNISFDGCEFVATSGSAIWFDDVATNTNVAFTDCTFEGTATLGANKSGEMSTAYSFTNCDFSKPSKWPTTSNIVLYAPTTFTNCTFDQVFGIRAAQGMVASDFTLVNTNTNIDLGGLTMAVANADGLFAFADKVNNGGKTYSGQTISLIADIDLKNKPWTPIGQTGATQFLGTFDGQGHTISNLYIDNKDMGEFASSGLFGWIERHGTDPNYLMAVKNVKVDGANVFGYHNVSVIAGYLIGTVEGCEVTNATLVSTHIDDNACGDKVGVIVGNAAESSALIKDCHASNSQITAGRDAGQIVGAFTTNPSNVIGCSATNVTVKADGTCTSANVKADLIGRTN